MSQTHRKRLPLIIIGVLALGAGIVGWWWNSPSRSSPISSNQTTVLGTETETTSLKTTYISTQMPSSFRLKSSSENALNPIIGQYLLTNKNTRLTDQVGITIGKLQDNTIDTLSSVQLRNANPDKYQRISLSYAPVGSIIFTSQTTGYEKSIFWTHGELYAAVVVSGTSDQVSSLDNALAVIINSWQWR